jgi:hypothetical protein
LVDYGLIFLIGVARIVIDADLDRELPIRRAIGISNSVFEVFERRRPLAKRDIETTTACRERAGRGFSGLTRA